MVEIVTIKNWAKAFEKKEKLSEDDHDLDNESLLMMLIELDKEVFDDDDNQEPSEGFEEERVDRRGGLRKESRPGAGFSTGGFH